MREFAARAAVAAAVLCAIWAGWLILAGGVDIRLMGLTVTSNEPLRPLLLGSLALAVYAAVTGVERARDRWAAWIARAGEGRLAVAIAIVTTVVGLAYSVTAATSADAYGYVSQAELWIQGGLKIPQPWVVEAPWPEPQWTFTPLGYRPAQDGGQWAIVPTYSPGLPLLMAGAKLVGGQEAMFWIVPFAGGLLVLATYGIGCRLGSASAGLVAAWLVATSPIVLFMIVPAMTDIPVAAAWALAFYFALGAGGRSAAVAGLVTAAAILIRPNLAPLAAPIALWLWMAPDGGGVHRPWRRRAGRVAVYAATASPGVIGTAAVYASLYGSPFLSGYGGLGGMFDWANVRPNVRNYLTWFIESQTVVPIAGAAALVAPARPLWPWVRDRRVLAVIVLFVAFVIVQYVTYLVFDTWWFLRFFLPCWPFLMIGLSSVALALARPSRPAVSLLVWWGVLALGAWGVHEARDRGAFEAWRGERRYVDVARVVAGATPDNSVIYTLLHSGSLRYYGSRLTLRSDILHPEWLDRSAGWLASRGVRAYLLLEEWEVADFKKRYAGQDLAAELDSRLALVYRGPSVLHLYDLNGTPPATPRVVPGADMRALRSVPPSPRPSVF
jgi:hypothetical protein